jgi:hypothetical protein
MPSGMVIHTIRKKQAKNCRDFAALSLILAHKVVAKFGVL